MSETYLPAELTHAPGPLAHQFEDMEQQHGAGELGMWLFLVTEVLFFGGLFCAYTIYRTRSPETEAAFAEASHQLNLRLGTANTAVLLTSSLTMVLAVNAAMRAQQKKLFWMLIGTIVFGTAFLVIKYFEWKTDYHEGLIPLMNLPFRWEAPEHNPATAGTAMMFFNLYFFMTGLHALHMVIGIGFLLLYTYWAHRGHLLGECAQPVHLLGLYWHFVDIVWVFLYPFLYLVGTRA